MESRVGRVNQREFLFSLYLFGKCFLPVILSPTLRRKEALVTFFCMGIHWQLYPSPIPYGLCMLPLGFDFSIRLLPVA